MFGIGFFELLIIAVVTLLIVGPEKLPETIRTISLHLARIRRFWVQAKQDIEREVGMEDIRREIHNAEVMEQLKETQTMLNQPAEDNSIEPSQSDGDQPSEDTPEQDERRPESKSD